jgi:hypothetical protein
MGVADLFSDGVVRAITKGKDTKRKAKTGTGLYPRGMDRTWVEVVAYNNSCACYYYNTKIATVKWDDDKVVTDVHIESLWSSNSTRDCINAIMGTAIAHGLPNTASYMGMFDGCLEYAVKIKLNGEWLFLPLLKRIAVLPISVISDTIGALHTELSLIKVDLSNGKWYKEYRLRKRDLVALTEAYTGNVELKSEPMYSYCDPDKVIGTSYYYEVS